MKFIKLDEEAVLPRRATELSAGYDFHALHGGVLESGDRMLVRTGIGWHSELTCLFVGILKGRSSLAYKHGINVLAGVIDADYDGDIGFVLHNTGRREFEFSKGDKIGQMVLGHFALVEGDNLASGYKRAGGFGSTDE